MITSPLSSESISHAVGSSSAALGATMIAKQIYMLVSSTGLWWSQGATPTATAGAGSTYLPPSTIVLVSGDLGADVAVIQDSGAGSCSLTRVLRF